MFVQVRQRFRQQDFRRTQSLHLVRQCVCAVDFGQHEAPAADIDPGQPEGSGAAAADRQQGVVPPRVEQGFVADRAGRDDAHDFALHRPLARRGVADLLANGDGFAGFDEAREIAVGGMIGNAAHRNRRAGGLAAGGQRDIENLCGDLGVAVKEFVEIPHTVEQQAVRMLRLDAQVLLHHGSMRRMGCRLRVETETELSGSRFG